MVFIERTFVYMPENTPIHKMCKQSCESSNSFIFYFLKSKAYLFITYRKVRIVKFVLFRLLSVIVSVMMGNDVYWEILHKLIEITLDILNF